MEWFYKEEEKAVNINEIRIDQTSTDNDEYFELAGLLASPWTDSPTW